MEFDELKKIRNCSDEEIIKIVSNPESFSPKYSDVAFVVAVERGLDFSSFTESTFQQPNGDNKMDDSYFEPRYNLNQALSEKFRYVSFEKNTKYASKFLQLIDIEGIEPTNIRTLSDSSKRYYFEHYAMDRVNSIFHYLMLQKSLEDEKSMLFKISASKMLQKTMMILLLASSIILLFALFYIAFQLKNP